MSRSVTATARYVEVEIDLEEIDTDDLIQELAERNAGSASGVPSLQGEETHPLHEIYYALKFGLDERAAALTRKYVCDELGVVL